MRYAGDMENTIQPILCCVGAEVAGEPTQFLMERACSAAHPDWRVITVEVTEGELQRAWDGMSVMRFRAARFFKAHQAASMRMVGAPSIDDEFIGGITSAKRVGDQWTMWHNTGPALVELFASRGNWANSVCWLHGDSSRQRSLIVACAQHPPREIFWTGSTAELPAELVTRVPLRVVPSDREPELTELLTQKLSASDPGLSLIHAGEIEPRHYETLLACQPSSSCNLTVVSQAPGTRRKLSDQWRAGEVLVLSLADLVVAEEGYDQARWTGRPTNLELLREAYEEYADF